MFDLLTHVDWSIAAGKRWATTARRLDGRWMVDAPRAVSDCDAFGANVVAARSGPDRRRTGFDFPIGVPESYGIRTGFNHFRGLLENAGTGQWSDFFTVATSFNEVSLHRPFYPHRSNNGAKTAHLFEGLGVETIDDLRRRCDLPTPTRRAACALFWTLGLSRSVKPRSQDGVMWFDQRSPLAHAFGHTTDPSANCPQVVDQPYVRPIRPKPMGTFGAEQFARPTSNSGVVGCGGCRQSHRP